VILSSTQTRSGTTTLVTVVSSLTGTVYYHWYMDGAYLGFTTTPSRSFTVERDEQVSIDVLDTNDVDFDPVANAPAGYPARRTLVWTRSVDASVYQYRIEQRQDGGAWETLGYALDDASKWLFRYLTPRLDDLSEYEWRVIPMDLPGNDGTAISLGVERIVRTPDAPEFTATFDEGSTEVLFAEVA